MLPRLRSLAPAVLRLVTAAAMLAAVGCAAKLPPEAPWEKDARALLAQADGMFAKKQYDQANRTLDAFFGKYPTSRSLDRALALKGELRLIQRDYGQALSYFKEIIEKFPASPLIPEAKYKLGLCYYEVREYDLAIANLADRGRITDPAKLKRIAETLASAYVNTKNYRKALVEYVGLADAATDDKQRAGYRDRVREIITKNLSESEVRNLAEEGTAYPADVALLHLGTVLTGKRNYRDAVKTAQAFLDRFPGHPEKVKADLILSEATAMLSAPRYYLAALLPRTGPFAVFGDPVLRGIQLALHSYNQQDPDNRVELIVKDTEGSPEKAVAALSELSSKGIIAAVGPLLTREAEAVAPALEKLQVPVITPAASGPGLGQLSPWLFRNALTNATQAAAAAQYALTMKYRKFVIFYSDDAYGKDISRLFAKELVKKAEILANLSYPADANDFGPWIKRIIEADLRSRKIPIPEDEGEKKRLFAEYVPSFDAVFLPGTAERVGLLIPQLAFYNITNVAVIGSNSWHSPDLIDRAGRHAEGAVFVDGFYPESIDHAVKGFADAYRSAYQEEPDILAAQSFDSTNMILSLLREGKDTPQAVKQGLQALRNYPGITGMTSFPVDGEAQKKLFVIKVQDGRFSLVQN